MARSERKILNLGVSPEALVLLDSLCVAEDRTRAKVVERLIRRACERLEERRMQKAASQVFYDPDNYIPEDPRQYAREQPS